MKFRSFWNLVCVVGMGWAACAEPVKTHPRLMFRAEDLPGLRARMNPTNAAWTEFKTEVVDKCLRDWKCSATHHYTGAPDYQWVRDSFTDEFGVTHLPTLANGDPNPAWGSYSNQAERPAAPEDDVGEPTGNVRMFSEQYAMIFAFMARMLKDDPNPIVQAQRAEYLAAARECLFAVIDHAHLGIANLPWRAGNFAQNDRSFSAEAFGLAVDWIYEDFTAVELAKIRKSFLIWAAEANDHVYFAPHKSNGQHGPVNSTELLRLNDPNEAPRYEVRLALNNHYANHARELVLYALALDPKDDVPVAPGSPADGIVTDAEPAGALTSYTVAAGNPNQWVKQPFGVLRDTIGVWVYLMDYAYRHDGAGGISMEGTQYASNGLGPAALMMLALHTAGQDDPNVWGPQVSLQNHPFWSRMIPAYLAMLTPAPRVPGMDTGENYRGPIFQPPLTGDLETYLYLNNQFIKVLAPLAIHDARLNGPNGSIAQAVNYIQYQLAPGGAPMFGTRMASMRSNKTLRDAIFTFMACDPNSELVDPRPALQAKTFFSGHTVNGKEMGKVLARSGFATNDTYFYTHLDWIGIDHIRGDSMTFGLWKNGLWLTKPMTGYGVLQGCSDYRNSLALQNGTPTSTPVGEDILAAHGSQWNYSSFGDPQILARSFGENFIYMNMDGTALYQHRQQTQLREVTHASRRIVWLKPGVMVIHDSAASKQAGYFKRFVINTPDVPTIAGNVAHASAKEDGVSKAELYVSQLLPAGATMQVSDIASGQPSGGEDMKARLITEAPGAPQAVNFLHVVEGADPSAPALPTALVASSGGTEFEGALVGTTLVLFKKNVGDPFTGVVYSAPAATARHFITGLAPNTAYGVAQMTLGGQTEVTISPGGATHVTDAGGVLILGNEPIAVALAATDSEAAEDGLNPATFTISRSGSLTGPLVVHYTLGGTATAGADYAALPGAVTIPANAVSATIPITPLDDGAFEGAETVVLTVSKDAAYAVDDAANSVAATIADTDAPPGGYLQFAGSNFAVNENDGTATVTLKRLGGSVGAASAVVNLSANTATSADVQTGGQLVAWSDGEAGDKTVSFTVINNSIYEGNKIADLTLVSVTGQAAAGTPAAAILTIIDDEPTPPGQIVFAAGAYSVGEGGGSITIPIARINGSGGAATVNINVVPGGAIAGADFNLSATQLAWASGETGSKDLVVQILNDQAYEGDEAFTLNLSIIAGAATLGGTSSATVTILDDDPQPQDYDVGPGFAYTTIGSVPWKNLGPGAVVRIHWRATPYHEKVLISGRGTAEEKIIVTGVPGPGGAKPIIDGANATSSGSLGYEGFSYTPQLGIVSIARGANTVGKVGYIELSGLEIRGSTGANYLDTAGVAQSYWSSGGAIYLRGAEHVVIRDCDLNGSPNGLVAENYSSESEINRDLLIENCWFHNNADAATYSGCNLQIEAIGAVVQGCRIDANNNRDKTASVRDRSAGAIYRYNWIEGGSYLIEMIEPTGAIAAVTGNATYGHDFVYGNVFVNRQADGSSLVRYGGTPGAANLRTQLAFYHNTVQIDSTSSGRAVFSPAGPGVTIDARNNIFDATAAGFQFASNPGVVTLGKNWARTGWTVGANGTVVGTVNLISGSSAGFAGADYHLAAGSPSIGAAGPLAPGAEPILKEFTNPVGLGARLGGADLGAFGFYVAPMQPNFAVAALNNGDLIMNIEAQPQSTWALESSVDFVAWQFVGAVTTGADGKATRQQPVAGSAMRFFRLKEPSGL